jgi:1-aminocyclopropane-1-carboxylate deaminase/D-cysteine desulfhydrase-like pyridoxal-dependent ACC family enzyme
VSADLGIDLWIKRDDLTGFAMGGNKARKLELLVPPILEAGCDWVVTAGSTQSNFVRQTGAACRMAGLGCTAVVMDMPYDGPSGKPSYTPPDRGGNVLLDEFFGVELVRVEDSIWEDLDEARLAAVEEKRRQGKKVYDIPVGGSTPLGALGFALAGEELMAQGGQRFSAVVTASSSGSTQTGLAYALAGTGVKVVGIGCDPEPEMPHYLADLAGRLDDLTGKGVRLTPDDLPFLTDWVGDGYNVPSEKGARAAEYLAEREGILLDPIYSAKGFAGLLDLARSGQLTGSVVFWHTGGMPTLFAY